MSLAKNAMFIGSGFVSAQIEPEIDDETATLLRIIGSNVATHILLPNTKSNRLVTLASMVYSGLHGYHRNNESLAYGLLWALATDSGAGVALGQQYQVQAKKKQIKKLT